MPQETNLNVAPYFDDFDANNDYYKVLFKPGYPVQARELNNLQSILQNQVETFGKHLFKEGAKVIPGNTAYNTSYFAVQLVNTYLGVPVSNYVSRLMGAKITGQTSGVTAVVEKVLVDFESEAGNTTLYISYLGSDSSNNTTQVFSDGELLTSNETIATENTIIAAGEPFASTIPIGAAATGSAFSIQNGVYFAKGSFVIVDSQTILLDQYGSTPSYRIGLTLREEIINADLDPTLNDNAGGFNNFSAPGADRLKITAFLIKKQPDDFNDNDFIELATISNGILRSKKQSTDYALIQDELARRTYAESGDYYVTPFDLVVKNSLNDNLGNRGVFNANQLTYGGSSPSEDLALYKVSPGKAFVKGYEIETISPTYLDVLKPRTLKVLEDQAINYNTGSTLKLNRVFGAPTVGIGNTFVLSLRSARVGTAATSEQGKEIGLARVYDFKLDSGSYNAANSNINEWDISLYDVQTVTEITLNEPITLSTPTFVKGANSGATAFLKSSVAAGVALTVYEKTGEFIKNESFIFDGVANTRVATSVTSFGIGDVKSVHAITGSASTITYFSADTIQSTFFSVGVASISAAYFDGTPAGITTVVSTNPSFPGGIKIGNLVRFTNTTSNDPTFASVVSVASSSINIAGVTTVTGVTDGALPATQLNVSDFTVVASALDGSIDNSFYTVMPKENIAEIDLTDASISIRKTFSVNIVDNELGSVVTASTKETFEPFDVERYQLIRSDGSTEVLTSDKFEFTNGNTQIQIRNLGSNNTSATLVATLKKLKPKSKVKLKNRVISIVVDKSSLSSSGIGSTTLGDGLTFGNYPFGTRVQDENISLNTPDIVRIHAVYESINNSDPSAPTIQLSSITGPTGKTSDLIIGEQFVGQATGSIAIVAERNSDSTIQFIAKNNINFAVGEVIVFQESNIQAVNANVTIPSLEISSGFTFDNGQNTSFYDYGFLTRKKDAKAPIRKLKVYFETGYYQSTDEGDVTTVASYDTFDFARDVQFVNGIRNTDLIDIRPRVSDYTVSEGARSPLEFNGRTFTGSGNSAANILASNESIVTDFSFYLGRIDRVYVTKSGTMQVKYGTPSEKPQKPAPVEDALEIATINLPPYLYDVSQASLSFLNHKRYRMVDIKKLENRIKNLEYYTALSLLETNTANLFIPDASGLNKFKSGFFVDNFSNLLAQEEFVEFKNSIDIKNKELRPQHHTDSIDLILGPVEGNDPAADLQFAVPEGSNISKTGDIITLDYTETEWLKQTFATRTESVTPFLVSFWNGSMELTPATDTWTDTVRLEAKIINTEGNYAETLEIASRTMNVDPQTGFAPTVWNAWETEWTGQEIIETSAERIIRGGGNRNVQGPGGRARQRRWQETVTDTVVQDTFKEVRDTGIQTRSGTRTIITEQFDTTSAGDRVVNRNLISFMRSRNIQFVSKRMKPSTRMYAFFDGEDVTKYCTPKLLEITMSSGTFQVSETVTGRMLPPGAQAREVLNSTPSITFRVATSNHKEGPYNAPLTVFRQNPYDGSTLPSTYSSTSTVLNVDTFSLANQPEGAFEGYTAADMYLTGQTSGAQARISRVRLLSDISATLIGSFYIPDPNSQNNPRFETGQRVFTLVNNENNDQSAANTIAEEAFTASGTLETVQENIISVRNARIENKQEFGERTTARTTGTQLVATNVISTQDRNITVTQWYDPLAQSFLVDDETGIFLTSCEVFLASKDDNDIPITFQIRTMNGGVPTQKVVPFSEVILDPDEVNISADGSVPTKFTFNSPVYLEGGSEYAIALASISTKYSAYISRIGEEDILTQTFISNQPYLGSLFKSQNASTWEPSQWEDLKFTLYRADFVGNGSVEFYNPELSKGNGEIARLLTNPLEFTSRTARIGIGSTLQDTDLQLGNTISQLGTNATGDYVGNAGIATGTLQVINSGIGYTPSQDTLLYGGVPLTTITGSGSNAKANITINNGVAVAATISESGTGYVIGDVLGIGTIGNDSLGSGARLSVVSISTTTQLILENVQGDFIIAGSASTVQYFNNSGITTDLNAAAGGNVQISSIDVVNDGMHFVVNHKNHGMNFSDNFVTLSEVKSDITPTRLSVSLNATSTSPIQIDDVTNFGQFESVGVGTTNLGYAKIGDEIVSYTTAAAGTLGGTITRSVDSSTGRIYPAGTEVYKYENSGISLRRINKTHNLNKVTASDPITFDSYNIKLDMGSSGVGRSTGESFPKLYVGDTKSTGGSAVRATQNIPFELITPSVQTMSVQGTSISAQLRSTTATSISGTEIPYANAGFENVTLNKTNYLTSPRLVASKINETNKLSTLPGNKSLGLKVNLNSVDSRLSPVVDTQRVSAILISNRVNNAVSNFATDNRVNTIFEDPSAFQYLSKEITLENPATSLKILVNAHVNTYSTIRAFYAISEDENFNPIYRPFPGYNNINERGNVIDPANNDGLPDTYNFPTDNLGFESDELDYREYTFTADELPSFRTYRIKLVATSTSQVYVPRMTDLRVIALA